MDIFNLLFADFFEEITMPEINDYCICVDGRQISFLGYLAKHSRPNRIMTFNTCFGSNYIDISHKMLFKLKPEFTYTDIFNHIQQGATLDEPTYIVFRNENLLNFALVNDCNHIRNNVVKFDNTTNLYEKVHKNDQRVAFAFNQSYILK